MESKPTKKPCSSNQSKPGNQANGCLFVGGLPNGGLFLAVSVSNHPKRGTLKKKKTPSRTRNPTKSKLAQTAKRVGCVSQIRTPSSWALVPLNKQHTRQRTRKLHRKRAKHIYCTSLLACWLPFLGFVAQKEGQGGVFWVFNQPQNPFLAICHKPCPLRTCPRESGPKRKE